MAEIAALRHRITSIRQTLKITNAMYLISSAKMKKTREHLRQVEPYFEKITNTIADILIHSHIDTHRYFGHVTGRHHHVGCLVITGDKGLAGAYNHNVLNLATRILENTDQSRVFMIGETGRHIWNRQGFPIDHEFSYVASDPTLTRAREISRFMLDLYNKKQLHEICIVYTHMINQLRVEPRVIKLLPLDPEEVTFEKTTPFECNLNLTYTPSVDNVLEELIPAYLSGVIYGALVESFCSEQSSRMNAMKSATDNANDMIQDLTLLYNRYRQNSITQEIAEVASGAVALKKNQ